MRFKWVFTKDWHGVTNQFRILNLICRDNGAYSCVFVNSAGETEKKLVSEKNLIQ